MTGDKFSDVSLTQVCDSNSSRKYPRRLSSAGLASLLVQSGRSFVSDRLWLRRIVVDRRLLVQWVESSYQVSQAPRWVPDIVRLELLNTCSFQLIKIAHHVNISSIFLLIKRECS